MHTVEMPLRELGARAARASFGDLLNRAAYANERTIITKSGRAVAVVVPVGDLERLTEEGSDARGDSARSLRVRGP